MTTRRILDIREEEVGRFPRAMLADAEVVALNGSGKFEVDFPSRFNGDTYGIRSRGWIGQIPVGDNLFVRVSPKVPVGNLFRMLEIAYNLQSFRLFDVDIQIESLEDVYERIVSILVRRVLDRARKGLYRNYIGEADELSCLRGRIELVGTVLNSMRGIPRIKCRYEEHSPDIDDNRILMWTLSQVQRQALRQERVRIGLDHARRALNGTIALKQSSAKDCVNRLYHRLNYDYAPMHGLCRFILEQTGPHIEAGDQAFIPFELNMPQLFETFVAEWLRTNAPPGINIRCQHKARLDSNLDMKIHVDILLCEDHSRRPIAALDTKYKANLQPSDADIYQIAFYARELHVARALLVYPSMMANSFRMVHGKNIVIENLVFDIGAAPDVAGANFLEALNTSLARQIT
jgi:5-methylcytosine-specific restriction enzyme subunit McrC